MALRNARRKKRNKERGRERVVGRRKGVVQKSRGREYNETAREGGVRG